MKILKILAIAILLNAFPSLGLTAGYSNWAVPTTIEYVNGGILVEGAFSDINACGQSNFIFIQTTADEKWFQSALSMVMMAFAAKKEVRFYSNSCTSVSFHWGQVNNINAAYPGGFYVR